MEEKEMKNGDNMWITFGFIFAFLGGVLGIGMGINYITGNYDKNTKIKGWIMAIIGFIMSTFWKEILK